MSQILRPRVGISACLAGERVRFNASSSRADWIEKRLAPLVELIPACPEMAMGLGTPREALRLVRGEAAGETRLVTSKSARDLTDLARVTAARMISALPPDLDAYILMGRSPTCGPANVKVYDGNKVPQPGGVGLFAAALAAARPELLTIEGGRLTELPQREHFVMRLFVQARAARLPRSVEALMLFHREHKFLLMAQGVKHLKLLGGLAARARRAAIDDDLAAYRHHLSLALAVVPKRPAISNALQHMYGFVKQHVSSGERDEILRRIEGYAKGLGTLQVPLALLRYQAVSCDESYLLQQAILNPYPELPTDE